MTAEFPHDFVQETLERLDSCHDGDFSRILLRMEYLDRIILNCGELADSIESADLRYILNGLICI